MGNAGALVFGVVVGWITYRTLRRSEESVGLSDIATVIGAVGGGLVVQLFNDEDLFGFYCVGLAIGFFGYLIVAWLLEGKQVTGWMNAQNDAPKSDAPFGGP